MSDAKQLEATRVVHAPAARVFAILADPRRHEAIDGSGMLRGTDSGPITAAVQVFAMNMHHDGLGDYRAFNTVTEFEPGVVLGWAPGLDPDCEVAEKLAGITTGGHTYTYRLREVAAGTEVTEIYDWSGVQDPQFEAFCPMVSREQLAGSLERLARAVEGGPGDGPDPITALERAYEQMARYVAGLDPDRLSAATPCAGWDVRALLNHVLAAAREFTLVNRGQSAGPAALDLLSGAQDLMRGDPSGALTAAAKENLESWRRPGALDGERTYSFGTFPAPAGLMINLDEVVVHGWDLAKATGQDASIDPGVAEILHAFYRSVPLDHARAVGFFAPEIPVPESAPVTDRLGRQP
ncbi:TIGR03086 family metal-binding protein [Pseudonocardia sp. RS11V-5]|uniref:TIGR03086 family metal-binding protein n=1 Tax=Pseudonocardia terrae TaxID=2905831 RepID=UPI001E40ED81|nr:TIGR03086 family metal-binding protein [Pseudonocardia terrae]MCE3554422.1 TIGR03086 family metal-binding protein [Pseudonocardia terrae]